MKSTTRLEINNRPQAYKASSNNRHASLLIHHDTCIVVANPHLNKICEQLMRDVKRIMIEKYGNM